MNTTPFAELPEYWQRHIHQLRSDRANLRKGVYTPAELASTEKLRKLRVENAKMRRERNEARSELAAVRAELEAGK